MHVSVKWIDGVSFIGESETGHAVVMDGAPENLSLIHIQMCIRDRCYQAALQQNLLIRPVGNTVYFMPPYTITFDEINTMVTAAYQAVKNSI